MLNFKPFNQKIGREGDDERKTTKGMPRNLFRVWRGRGLGGDAENGKERKKYMHIINSNRIVDGIPPNWCSG